MNESLVEACNEFEQLLLAGMLRSAAGSVASTGKSDDPEDAGEAGFTAVPREESEGYAQLFAQALAGAVERAGGVGVARLLATAAGERRP